MSTSTGAADDIEVISKNGIFFGVWDRTTKEVFLKDVSQPIAERRAREIRNERLKEEKIVVGKEIASIVGGMIFGKEGLSGTLDKFAKQADGNTPTDPRDAKAILTHGEEVKNKPSGHK